MRTQKWLLVAIAIAALVFIFSRRAPNRPTPSQPQREASIASEPDRGSQPAATPSSPTRPARYTLLGQNCPVLAVRDEASTNPRETRRAWLIELAPFGRVRVEETLARADDRREEHVLRRDAFVAGDVLVAPQPGEATALPAAFAQAGAISWERVPATEMWLVRFANPDLDTLPNARGTFARQPQLVQHTEGNGIGTGGFVPNDSLFSQQYSMRNTGQSGGVAGADVRATSAWDISSSAAGIIVAELDSGIDYNHPDLTANIYRDAREVINGLDDDGNGFIDDFHGWNFVSNNNDPLDDHNHGTHVAGIIGARGNNGSGVAGVAWTVQLLPVKVLDSNNSGSTAWMLSGINYARAKGARVMNLSLINYPFSTSVSNAIDAAAAAGVLMVISAGNSGTNNDAAPNYPSSYAQANIISVANTTNADVLNTGSFEPSNYGATTVDLAAPGANVLSTLRGNTYGLFTGTSMSAPHVTGTAALLFALRADASYSDVKRWILDSADRLPSLTGKCVTGARLNIAAALQLANASLPPSIATQPQSQTGVSGQTVTFAVTASGGSSPTYQWQRSSDGGATWSNLANDSAYSGATTTTLTITSVAAAMQGAQFRVVASSSFGTATSNAATLSLNLVPAISTQPVASQQTPIGRSTTFTVVASGTPAPTYQWQGSTNGGTTWSNLANDSTYAGVTTGTLTVNNVTSAMNGYQFRVIAANSLGSVTSTAGSLVSSVPGHLINLSVLAPLTAGGDSFSLGYVVSGASAANPKPLVIRAAGPALGALGYPSVVLADPRLELFAASTKSGENDDWGGLSATSTAMAAVGAFAYPTSTSRDAAVVANITSRDNSVKISAGASAPNGTGAVIAEVYDATPTASFNATTTPRLINFSVIKNVGPSVTLGFVVGGTASETVLVRAIGPSLATLFSVVDVMADPKVELFDAAGNSLATNDNWGGTAALTAAFGSTGAFALPASSKDAVLTATLTPGNYSAVVTPAAGTATGTALLEVYEVP